MAFRIVTDTTADYTALEVEEKGLFVVPMKISFNGKEYADGIDLTHSDFYDLLASSEEFPKTSQPAPDDFIEVFQKIKQAGDTALVILVSSKLSGTVQSALTAKAMLDYEKIYVVDSQTATVGIQFLIEAAQKMIDEGETVEQIVGHLEELKMRVRIFAGIDTLKYLYKGGRLSRLEAGLGTLAGIHPILRVVLGKVEVVGKCMGLKKTMRTLADMVGNIRKDPAYPMRLIYSANSENCEALSKLITAGGDSALQLVEIGATIGAHTGPKVYGMVFIEEKS